ncbi:MAG TPA: FG-GAP-like repeat-containing protein, partial [Acidimicrobiia bacterium]|nr:FG-GAP-like repeat-containing protein [Acidimicrobiia bacterium]
LALHVAFSLGASWVDYDGDGDLDLYVVTGFSANNENVLYRNDQGTLVRVTGVPLVEDAADSPCSAWGDYDNDGAIDAFVSNLVASGGMLFHGGVLDTTAGVTSTALKGTGCAWGDYDNDGRLDLVVSALFGQGNIVTGNRLFHGGGNGTFTEVTVGPMVTTQDTHHHPTWADYDGDGDLDLFFATGPVGSTDTDRMYRNLLRETGAATFAAITTAPIATDARDSQQLSWVDYDDDGDLDLYAVNYTSLGNQLYRNDGGGAFTKITTGTIVTDTGANHGVVWGDFDLDGDQDAYVARDNTQSNRYYRNEGNGTFTRISAGAHVTELRSNYGAAAGDYDGDGDLDLFVPTARSEGPSLLFRNDLASGNHWAAFRLEGTVANRTGLGAKVRVRAVIAGVAKWQMRELRNATCYGGHDALEAHFGLGDAATIDSVRVEWPGGTVDTWTNLPADTRRELVEGATVLGVPPAPKRFGLSTAPNPSAGSVRLSYSLPRPGSLAVFDARGRVVHARPLASGTMSVTIPSNVLPAAGVYMAVVRADGLREATRFVHLK